MRIVLLGPPGSGKGTQAQAIAKYCGFLHISTGDMLREAADQETELGRQAKGYMEAGELVPDETMISIIENRLSGENCRGGFVLDGFPRTVNQARELEDLLKKKERELDIVFSLEVESERIVERLSNRRLCRNCNRDYNLLSNPPEKESRCTWCGGVLYQREDDRAETITNRMQVYEAETAPLKAFYAGVGLLQEIDGNGDVEKVFRDIASHLNCIGA
ncbi:MAG: adenylate kinase [Gemmatimonadota bacterium]|nr:MAG: adenylate kinase [Gemmatimonadota bacterium]